MVGLLVQIMTNQCLKVMVIYYGNMRNEMFCEIIFLKIESIGSLYVFFQFPNKSQNSTPTNPLDAESNFVLGGASGDT